MGADDDEDTIRRAAVRSEYLRLLERSSVESAGSSGNEVADQGRRVRGVPLELLTSRTLLNIWMEDLSVIVRECIKTFSVIY